MMASFDHNINRRSSLGVELYSFQFGHRRQSHGAVPKVCSFDCANCRKLMLSAVAANRSAGQKSKVSQQQQVNQETDKSSRDESTPDESMSQINFMSNCLTPN